MIAGGACREAYGHHGLEQRIERAAEQSGLLTGDHRDRRRISQRLGRGEGSFWRTAPLLLCADQRDHAVA